MTGRWILLVASIGMMLLGTPLAQAEGWKMPSLNPFKRKTSHPAHLRMADDERPWWKPKLPAIPTLSSGKAKSKSSGASPWSKMTRGTKAAWSKTTDALNPFDDEPERPKSITGYGSPFAQSSARKEEVKKASWWSPFGDEPKEPETVQDFLGMERPR